MPTNCTAWRNSIEEMPDGPEKDQALQEWTAYCTVNPQAIDEVDEP